MKKRITVFYEKKGKEKLALLTAYDYSTAKIIDSLGIDAILVGDSLGMVFQGNDDTLPVTVDEMIYHTKAVRKGALNSFLIADMPFLSYHVSAEDAVRNAGRFIKEAGAEAVKIEGGEEILDKIKALISAKIPVMGHLGLTPQSVNMFGGYKVQAKTVESAKKLLSDALLLEKAGVFSIVLEGIPEKIAEIITARLAIPTIGIGAGRFVDGQILVINDVLGTYSDIVPKFAKVFADAGKTVRDGVKSFIDEVMSGKFPQEEHTYRTDKNIIDEISREKQ